MVPLLFLVPRTRRHHLPPQSPVSLSLSLPVFLSVSVSVSASMSGLMALRQSSLSAWHYGPGVVKLRRYFVTVLRRQQDPHKRGLREHLPCRRRFLESECHVSQDHRWNYDCRARIGHNFISPPAQHHTSRGAVELWHRRRLPLTFPSRLNQFMKFQRSKIFPSFPRRSYMFG